MNIPESIRRHLPENGGMTDDIGRSGGTVLVYPDRVLKVQPDCDMARNEHRMLKWLQGRLNVPSFIAEDDLDGMRYLVMSRMPGRYLCDEAILDDQDRLAALMAKALRALWAVDVTDCPLRFTLDARLTRIERELQAGRVSMEYAAPGTYGPDGFRDPSHLFDWLVANRPKEEDLVFSHGDCCLPNIFVDDADNIGFIDLGFCGVADRWRDIDKALWSMWANSTGLWGGKSRAFDPMRLYRALSMAPNEERRLYFERLDQLE